MLIGSENLTFELGSSAFCQVTVLMAFTVNLNFLPIIRDILTDFWPLPEVVESLRIKMKGKAARKIYWWAHFIKTVTFFCFTVSSSLPSLPFPLPAPFPVSLHLCLLPPFLPPTLPASFLPPTLPASSHPLSLPHLTHSPYLFTLFVSPSLPASLSSSLLPSASQPPSLLASYPLSLPPTLWPFMPLSLSSSLPPPTLPTCPLKMFFFHLFFFLPSLPLYLFNYFCMPPILPLPFLLSSPSLLPSHPPCLPGLLIGCEKNCKIMRHFQGRLCGKREQLCGRLCDFFKAKFELDFPFLRINSHASFV